MDITVSEKGPCRKEAKLVFSVDEIKDKYKKRLDVYKKQGNIRGFRPGKAPLSMVETQYRETIKDDVIDFLNYEAVEALKKKREEWKIINYVSVTDDASKPLDLEKAVTFTAILDCEPQFTLPDYKGLNITSEEIVVTPEDVQAALAQILKQDSDVKLVTDRPVGPDDYVRLAEVEGTCDGQNIEELDNTKIGRGQDVWTSKDSTGFPSEFYSQLIGLRNGDSKDIVIEIPANATEGWQKLAGKKLVYKVAVNEIRETVAPELNAEYFARYGVASHDELLSSLEKYLRNRRESERADQQIQEIIDSLLAKTSFAVPESELEEEARRVLYSMVSNSAKGGADYEKIMDKKEAFYQNAKASAEKILKTRYLIRAIAAAENIKISDDEMSEVLQKQMESQQQRPAKGDKRKRFNDLVERVNIAHANLTMNKVFDLLLKSANAVSAGAGGQAAVKKEG